MFTSKLPAVWISVLLNIFLVFLVFWSGYPTVPSLSKGPVSRPSFELSPANPADIYESYPIDFENATAIFNTVHGALKQKDSNMNPVGVSFIPAYVPPGTLMYHATNIPHIPDLLEWIAMDYEFSYSFAHFPRGKRREWGPPPPPPPPSTLKVSDEEAPFRSSDRSGRTYLYTFRNTRPLDKLIYLDGASAAKTNTGEMDQQSILSRQSNPNERVHEVEAAQEICKWGKTFGLQGVIRMEVGFEIILCSFHEHIELVSNVTLANVTTLGNIPYEKPVPLTDLEKNRTKLIDKWESMTGFDWLRAGASVNYGEKRIQLDFSKMVTPLNKTWIDADPYKRRINHIPDPVKEHIIGQLHLNLLLAANPFHRTNWQLPVERFVGKFAPMLIALNNSLSLFDFEKDDDLKVALEHAASNITEHTFNFVRRYSDEMIENIGANSENAYNLAVKDYCSHTYPIMTSLEVLIFSSMYRVESEVLQTIFDLYNTSRIMMPDLFVNPDESNHSEYKDTLVSKTDNLRQLLRSLRWSIFTKCSTACNWDEACYIPTWGPGPMGWGPESKNRDYFEYDGTRLRIPLELKCVSYRNLQGGW